MYFTVKSTDYFFLQCTVSSSFSRRTRESRVLLAEIHFFFFGGGGGGGGGGERAARLSPASA